MYSWVIDIALVLAIWEGDDVITSRLLDFGAHIDTVIPARSACTPSCPFDLPAICYAAYTRNLELARLLLSRGANPNLSSVVGKPITLASVNNHFALITLLRRYGAKVKIGIDGEDDPSRSQAFGAKSSPAAVEGHAASCLAMPTDMTNAELVTRSCDL